MPRARDLSLAALERLGRNNLPTIERLFSTFGHNNILFGNSVRSLFNLPTVPSAWTVINAALAFAETVAGQAALGLRPAVPLSDIPINPDLRSPFGDRGRIYTDVSFEINGEYYSIGIWSDRPLSQRDIHDRISDFIAANVSRYVALAAALHAGRITPGDVRIRLTARSY